MPVTKTEERIDFDFFPVRNAIADFGSQHGFRHLRFDGLGYVVDGKCLVVGELHPHEIEGHDHAVVARFHNAHRADVEILENIAETRVHARIMAERSGGSVNTGEPEIRSYSEMPTIIRGRFFFLDLRCGRARVALRLGVRPQGEKQNPKCQNE